MPSSANTLHPLARLWQDTVVEPFDGKDPVCLEELSAAQLAWRGVLHLLATHGDTLTLPAAFVDAGQEVSQAIRTAAYAQPVTLPAAVFSRLDISIAAGWWYLPSLTFDGSHVVIRCRFARDTFGNCRKPDTAASGKADTG